MAFDCTSCGRTSTADGAMFCMFSGERLSAPHATIHHLPEALDASNSGQDTVPDGPMPMRVGGYRIVRHLGEGGMGSVYEAADDESGKRVAVKLLSNKLASNPTSVERFRQEGRLASQL